MNMNIEKRLEPVRIPEGDDEEERFTAFQLIKMGIATGDEFTRQMGQARLRFLEGRPTIEDLELLEKIDPE